MTASVRRCRGGFTLIEVLIVAVIVGVLAGIATPALGRAADRAAAAKVLADSRTLALAVRSSVEVGNPLPESSDWAVPPPTLGGFLEENMAFSFRDADYRLVTLPAIGVAELWVRYPEGSGLGEALQRYRRPGEVTWTPTRTTFLLAR